MGIKLTTEVQTSEGATSSLYLNIEHIAVQTKSGSRVQFGCKFYTDPSKETECKIFEGALKNVYTLDVSGTLNDVNIKKAGYDKIGEILKAAELSPESDETGEWVAY